MVLDQFAGGGTTLVEAKLLNRNIIGVDVNDVAIARCKEKTTFEHEGAKGKVYIHKGDARNLDFVPDNSIDLICTHPPYANIIKYSKGLEGDISLMVVDDFLEQIKKVAAEAYRVLKKGKICAVMIGDIRRYGKVVPLGFRLMECFLQAGFLNKEIIIKEQHNCLSTDYWKQQNNSFLLLAHEYIFVFQKYTIIIVQHTFVTIISFYQTRSITLREVGYIEHTPA